MIGKEILGYHVDEKIGSGGFGTVYKVSKTNAAGTYVRALKHITLPTKKQYASVLNSMGGDYAKADDYFASVLNDIVSEIQILSTLSESGTKNIVRYYENDIIETPSPKTYDIYIMMEFLTPFTDYIESKPILVRDVIKLGKDILTALISCHEKSIIHRDIKDDNIFVSSKGEYKLGDFGVSKMLKDKSRAESVKGTPNFIAPEVYLGKEKYDHTVDLYSLGIVLYKLLNKSRNPFLPEFPEPYSTEDEDIAFETRMTGKVPSAPVMAKNKLGEVIVKAISPRAQRYDSAKEFYDALLECEKEMGEKALDDVVMEGTPINSSRTEGKAVSQGKAAEETIAVGAPSSMNETLPSEEDRHLFDTISAPAKTQAPSPKNDFSSGAPKAPPIEAPKPSAPVADSKIASANWVVPPPNFGGANSSRDDDSFVNSTKPAVAGERTIIMANNVVDVIKYEGDNNTFIWKHPREDFNNYTQLIVHESQEAVFFLNGQALDLFGPGRHTLETQNLPLVGKSMKRVAGGESPFHCEVYFINKTVQMGIKWGTPELVRFVEPTLGIPLGIGASGELNLAVSNARKLLVKLVGTTNGIAWEERGAFFTKSLQNCFRPLITTAVKTHLAATIKSQNIDLLDVDENLELLSEVLRRNITPALEEYGLTIPQFYITTINLPENDPNFKKLRELHTISLQTKVAEAEAAVRTAKIKADRETILEGELTATEIAKRQAERDLIKAQAEAQAKKMDGFAQAEIMQAQGYNQRDIIQAEVQKEYAKGIGNMTITGGGSVAGDMVGLGVGLAAAGHIAPQMGDMFKGFQPQEPVAPATTCPKCNASVPSTSKFCLECGAKIESLNDNEVICPSCGQKTAKGKFCGECGATLARKCAKCGTEINGNPKFCPECGEKL